MNQLIFHVIHILKNTDDKKLLQFHIEVSNFSASYNGTRMKAEFTMNRNPSYMIIHAYVPSFSLMLTTILPLYLKETIHFATTITLVLTSLLCSFTLFQSSLAGIPKTSYLKFIDYWNMLALTVTLVNFFTLAVPTIPLVTLIAVVAYWILALMLYLNYLN
jgi:hypothetical protein